MHVAWSIPLLAAFAAAKPFVVNKYNDVSYQGTSANGVEQFTNIFFAEDTGGKNRFEPPVPYYPPPGTTVDATQKGEGCPQDPKGAIPAMLDVPVQSENCLSIRIARPEVLPKKLLPVMVYIYGGGSILGNAYDGFFTPDGIIQQSVANGQPVIYAAMNYRIGVFGFAASKSISAAKKANVGLRDQYLALEWIRDNIAHFGGDPSRVTLFGQSFGGISTGLHLTAYGGERPALFHKAIMTSGSVSGDRSDHYTITNTGVVADELKCTKTPGFVDDSVIECMKEVPLDTIAPLQLALAKKAKPSFGFAAYPPVVDGDFIPEQPDVLLAKGRFLKNIPLIVTWAADDGTFSADSSIKTEQEVIDNFNSSFPDFSDEIAQDILKLYPVEEFYDQAASVTPKADPQYWRAARIQRDIDPTCPMLTISRALATHGTEKVYVAELNETRLTPYWDAWGAPLGVSHLSDVPYFFNEAMPAPADNGEHAMALSANYSGSFISFAHHGNPVHHGKTTFQAWPKAYTPGSDDFSALIIGGPNPGPVSPAPSSSTLHSNDFSSDVGSSKVDITISKGKQVILDALFESGSFAADNKASSHSNPVVSQGTFSSEKLLERCKYIYSKRI